MCRPCEWLCVMLSPGIGVQVVNKIAAAYNEYTFITKGRQAFAELVMKARGFRFVYAQLYDRNVSVRKYVNKNGPCPVIEAPVARVQNDVTAEKLVDPCRELS